MVNDDLTEAWLIDFEGAVQAEGNEGSPERRLGANTSSVDGLRDAIEEQKQALLKRFE